MRNKIIGLYSALAGVWLALVVALSAAVVLRDLNHARLHLAESVHNIQRHIVDIVAANEAILRGFAAYLEVQADFHSGATIAYAHRLMRHSPAI